MDVDQGFYITWKHSMSVGVFLSPEYLAANILATVHFLP